MNLPLSDFMNGYPDELKQWWDAYGPSNWGATSEETAAGIGIADLKHSGGDNRKDERYTWPGGLGAITKKLAEILQPKFPDRMQSGSTIVAVVPSKDDVQVTYMQGAELKTVAAKAVIMATPKFITRRLVEGLPQKQNDAMQQMRYIPYAVVNLIFNNQYLTRDTTTGAREIRLPISLSPIGWFAISLDISRNTISSPATLRCTKKNARRCCRNRAPVGSPRMCFAISKNSFPDRILIRLKFISTVAGIPCTCPRPAFTQKFNRQPESRWIVSSSRIPIRKDRCP